MKENLISDKSLIYQWYFNDNISVVDNPRVKATVNGNPTFKDGVCQFGNGTTNTTDSYTLKRIVNLGVTFSVSVKFKFNTLTGDAGILAYDGANYVVYLISGRLYFRVGVSSSYISFNRDLNWHEFTLTRNGSSVSAYLDGVSQTVIGTSNSTQNTLIRYIGVGSGGISDRFNGQLEYIKIWNRQLTASEVKNNYTGKTYRALPYVSGEILGSELVVNDDFSLWTGNTPNTWSTTGIDANNYVSNSGGACLFTVVSGNPRIYKDILTIGKIYKVTGVVAGLTGINNLSVTGTGGVYATSIIVSTNGVFSGYIQPTATTLLIGVNNANNTNAITLDNISVKEVLSSSRTLLFHINSDNGVIRDLTGKTITVPTNVTLSKIGSNINVMKFNGGSGNINLGTQSLLGDITFVGWINNANQGENNSGYFVSNGQLIGYTNTNKQINISRNNGSNTAFTLTNTLKFQNSQFICITSTSTGITNFYIGDKNNPPTLSGTANQNAGTPVAGSTCYLGNRATDDRTLNGWLNDIRCEQSILTLDEITQYYSVTKIKYN